MKTAAMVTEHAVEIPVGQITLDGDLRTSQCDEGVVLFAHGSGSSRHSPRNRFVAEQLNSAGFATLLMDLLTPEEAQADEFDGRLRFDIALLARRLIAATDWLGRQSNMGDLRVGYFGASTGAAAALVAAGQRHSVAAVVSRGGRPDMAGDALSQVRAPTLLIVGGEDQEVIELNRQARARLRCVSKLEIIPGATHLFEEVGTLEEVAQLAQAWFCQYLVASKVVMSHQT